MRNTARNSSARRILADGFPSAKTRIDRLDRVKDIHVRYKQQIVEALEADFGARPRGQSLANGCRQHHHRGEGHARQDSPVDETTSDARRPS